MKTLLAFFLLFCLSATAANLTLEWDANSEPDVAGYSLEMAIGDGPFVPHLSVTAAAMPFADVAGLAAGRYRFQVRAVTASGIRSEPSNILIVTVPEAPKTLRLRLQVSTDLQNWLDVAEHTMPEPDRLYTRTLIER